MKKTTSSRAKTWLIIFSTKNQWDISFTNMIHFNLKKNLIAVESKMQKWILTISHENEMILCMCIKQITEKWPTQKTNQTKPNFVCNEINMKNVLPLRTEVVIFPSVRSSVQIKSMYPDENE